MKIKNKSKLEQEVMVNGEPVKIPPKGEVSVSDNARLKLDYAEYIEIVGE